MKCKHKESTISRDGKECSKCGLNWYQCLQENRQKKKSKFPPELIKEYGEQTYRDRKQTHNSYDDCAECSVMVADACGYITEKEQKAFHKAIVKYARTTRFPKSFI
jgi:hypothetical protein